MTYEITSIGGWCPVQAEGIIDGKPFYFRARGEGWSFSVSANPEGDPVDVSCFGPGDGDFYYDEAYREGEQYSAGSMEESEAREFIEKAFKLYERREAMARDGVTEQDIEETMPPRQGEIR
jgi:hypothetical protein